MNIFNSEHLAVARNQPHSWSRWSRVPTSMVVGLLIFVDNSFPQATEANPRSTALKKLGLEELMNIEVTSVSKRQEK